MDNASAAIRTYFAKLGLSQEIADIYLALHASGPQSISELSRTSKVERTHIYRLLDVLMESGLIEIENHNKRGIIKAAPISNLNILINKREQELKNLQDELNLIEQVLARNSLSSPSTRVQLYSGIEGIKQMLWNQTKATMKIHSIILQPPQASIDNRFVERWSNTCNNLSLQFRSVFGKTSTPKQREWYAELGLADLQGRLIEDDTFNITQDVVVYDNIVSYFNWRDGEVSGIEIYNDNIANLQLQLFELLWQKAKTFTIRVKSPRKD